MRQKANILILIIIGLVVLSACTSSSKSLTGNTVSQTGEIKEFVMTSFTEMVDGKYYPQYSIKEITVNKGDLVRIRITNIRGVHDIKIDEFNVYAMTPIDQEVTVEFVADRAGTFDYYCTQPGHRQNGHAGKITVI